MESNWGLAPGETRRSHCWRCSLGCSRKPRIERAMERSWELVLCSRVRGPEESPRVASSESPAQFQWKVQHFEDTSTMRWLPRTAAVVGGASLSLGDLTVCFQAHLGLRRFQWLFDSHGDHGCLAGCQAVVVLWSLPAGPLHRPITVQQFLIKTRDWRHQWR